MATGWLGGGESITRSGRREGRRDRCTARTELSASCRKRGGAVGGQYRIVSMANLSDLWEIHLGGVRHPVWSDNYDAYRRFVDPTEDAYERPWCRLCTAYAGNNHGMLGPELICDADCYDGRLRDSTMFRRYWERILDITPSDIIPCTWCGFSATAMCESCDRTNGPASALCLHCENELSACRLCWATNYVKKQRKPTFPACVVKKGTTT